MPGSQSFVVSSTAGDVYGRKDGMLHPRAAPPIAHLTDRVWLPVSLGVAIFPQAAPPPPAVDVAHLRVVLRVVGRAQPATWVGQVTQGSTRVGRLGCSGQAGFG